MENSRVRFISKKNVYPNLDTGFRYYKKSTAESSVSVANYPLLLNILNSTIKIMKLISIDCSLKKDTRKFTTVVTTYVQQNSVNLAILD